MRFDVVALIIELGIEPLEQNGEEVIAYCPRHDDSGSKPNWSINAQTGQHHCWSCGYGGGVLSLIAERRDLRWPDDSLNLMEARVWARRFRAKDLTAVKALERTVFKPKHEKRTITINEHDLALFGTPPTWALDARNLSANACADLGVLWEKRSNSWITPIRDPWTHYLRGWQIKGAKDRMFSNYPVGVDKASTLFGLDAFEGGTAILVESPLDVVRLRTVGIPGGLATYGAAVSLMQIQVVISYADAVIIATDNPAIDQAGKTSALTLVRAFSRRMPTRVLNYGATKTKDIGDMTEQQIRWAITNAYSGQLGRRAVHA
jgi:5S rRNA maturation endonuclease (ribonuclease M5)